MASAYQAKVSGVQAKGTAIAARKKEADYAKKIKDFKKTKQNEISRLASRTDDKGLKGKISYNNDVRMADAVLKDANSRLAVARKIQKKNSAMAIDADKTSTRANDYAAIVTRKEAGVKKNSKTVNKVYRSIGK